MWVQNPIAKDDITFKANHMQQGVLRTFFSWESYEVIVFGCWDHEHILYLSIRSKDLKGLSRCLFEKKNIEKPRGWGILTRPSLGMTESSPAWRHNRPARTQFSMASVGTAFDKTDLVMSPGCFFSQKRMNMRSKKKMML